jgi:hypothetical protein
MRCAAQAADLAFYRDFAAYVQNTGAAADGQHAAMPNLVWWDWNPNSGDTGGIVGDDWLTVGKLPADQAPDLASPMCRLASFCGPDPNTVFSLPDNIIACGACAGCPPSGGVAHGLIGEVLMP